MLNAQINNLIAIRAKHAASGMQYLESKGVIHRDLALRNLLVTTHPEEKYLVKVAGTVTSSCLLMHLVLLMLIFFSRFWIGKNHRDWNLRERQHIFENSLQMECS